MKQIKKSNSIFWLEDVFNIEQPVRLSPRGKSYHAQMCQLIIPEGFNTYCLQGYVSGFRTLFIKQLNITKQKG